MSVFRTKPIEDVLAQSASDQADDAPHGKRLRKTLGPADLIGFGVGIVIGTGIFTLTGIEAKNHAGPAVVISFVVAGAVSLLAALCYSELASSVPTAGSAYTYAYATIGELAAWIIGWDLILEFALGASVVARGWSSYLQNLFALPTSIFGEHSTINIGAMSIALVLGVIAAVGIKESAWLTNLLVFVKVTICLFIIIAGAFFITASHWSPFIPQSKGSSGSSGVHRTALQALFGWAPSVYGIGGIVTAAAVVFFAYSGFEAVANMSEETRRPARDIPLGVLGTLAIATALYLGVSLVVTGMVDYRQLNEGSPLSSAFDTVGASWAGTLVSIAAVCGLTSVILVDIVTMGRILFAMGRDRLLPAPVGAINTRTRTPLVTTLAITAFVIGISGFVQLRTLADLVSIGTLFAFVVVSIAIPILRATKPDVRRPFRVPASPFIPILSAVCCLYLMLNLTVETWVRFLVWLAAGLVLYAFYGYRHARIAEPRPTTPQPASVD